MVKNSRGYTGLVWEGKRTEVDRVSLPFQTVETINEPRKEEGSLNIHEPLPQWWPEGWRNKLIWGDNKYIMSSLLEEFGGKINLIYIDPPFATGADFSINMRVGDLEWTKEASVIEEKAYGDTWGRGLDSYLQMMYDRLVLMKELLSDDGSIYVHLDWHVGHYVKLIMDEVFGKENFQNQITWYYPNKIPDKRKPMFTNASDIILFYCKVDGSHIFHPQYYDVQPHRRAREVKIDGIKQSLRDEKGNVIYHTYDKRLVDNVWNIPSLAGSSGERLDFPTQKPEALLERLIKTSSTEGGVSCRLLLWLRHYIGHC